MLPCKPCSPTYNPGWPGWVNLAPFRAWCAQTLPTVFDESMSYYELLCKLIEILNNTLNDVNIIAEHQVEVEKLFKELKAYVDSYFTNLDVQQEINNKLDSLVENGTLSNIVGQIIGNVNGIIVVDSIDKMVNKSALYALSTDTNGYVYYWDGTQWSVSAIKIGNLNGYLLSNYSVLNDSTIDQLTPSHKLIGLPVNSFIVASSSGTNLLEDLPEPMSVAFILTIGFGNTLQILHSPTKCWFRVVYSYTTNPSPQNWVHMLSDSDIINKVISLPIITEDNINEYFPNKKLSDANLNGFYIFGPSAVRMLTDINTQYQTLWLINQLQSGTRYQLLVGTSTTANSHIFYRRIFSEQDNPPWSPNINGEYTGFFGDSLCFRESSGFGFPSVLPFLNYENNGVSQAVMRNGSNSIQSQIDNAILKNKKYSTIFIEGGYNDWYSSTGFGVIPNSVTDNLSDVDRNTTFGGFQYCIIRLLNSMPNARLFYVTTHKINKAPFENNGGLNLTEIYNGFKAICELYGVCYIDIFNRCSLNTYFNSKKQFTTGNDGIHPTKDAFEKFYAPIIQSYLN